MRPYQEARFERTQNRYSPAWERPVRYRPSWFSRLWSWWFN